MEAKCAPVAQPKASKPEVKQEVKEEPGLPEWMEPETKLEEEPEEVVIDLEQKQKSEAEDLVGDLLEQDFSFPPDM